jgi:UDP:flavonoid glycosyltransferase YjiC (YdhE family)
MLGSRQAVSGMRVLMTLQPAWSHLNTLVPIARELERSGHEVRIATAASMADAVLARGLTPVAAGMDWDASRADDFFPGYLRARGASQAGLLVRLAGKGMVDDLRALCKAWRPDVLVRDASEFGAIFVGELLSIPVVVLGIGLRPPAQWMHKLYAPKFSALREKYGLPSESPLRDVTGDLWLASYPSDFAVAPAEDFEELHIRPVVADSGERDVAPSWLADVSHDSVYVSLGTVFNDNLALLRLLITTLHEDDGLEVIATTGRNIDPRALGELPRGVRAVPYLPQSSVAPFVKAVVSHGGFNTMMGAICAGLPVCCLPLGADHPQNASRCVDLGLGTAVTTHMPAWGYPVARPDEVSADALLKAVLPVVQDSAYRKRAQAMAAEIAGMPGPEAAVAALEALVNAG